MLLVLVRDLVSLDVGLKPLFFGPCPTKLGTRSLPFIKKGKD